MRGKLPIALALMLAVLAVGQKPSKDSLLEKVKLAKKKASAVRKELRMAKRQSRYVIADIHKTDLRLEDARERVEDTQARLREVRDEQVRIAEELAEATARLDEKKEVVGQRIRALYMQGDPSPLAAFVGAETFSDVAQRAYIVEKIAEMDNQLVTDLKADKQEVSDKKALADAVVIRIGALNQRQLDEKRQLNRHLSTKREYLHELRDTQDGLEEELDQLEHESRQIEAELRRYYGTPSDVPVWRGGFMQPIRGRLTSRYGVRRHPILRRTRMHTGVDIAAPSGTPIKAAGDGKVIKASYYGGYGNCVIIDHGGGVATLYGHCSRIYAGVGRFVKQGQTIAAVGSTGLSTGPHLHWEVRVNGAPVNPMSR